MKPMNVLALMESPRFLGALAFITAVEPAPAGRQVAFSQNGRAPACIGSAAITEYTEKAHLFGRDLAKRSTSPGIWARPPIAALIPCKAGSAVPFTQNRQEHQPHGNCARPQSCHAITQRPPISKERSRVDKGSST